MTPLEEIHFERKRQIDVEGWTPEHDDQHDGGEILTAAVIYYLHAIGKPLNVREDGAPVGWPWEAQWWKPKDRHRDLVRAGALCLAERERIKRKALADHPGPEGFYRRNPVATDHVGHRLGLIIDALKSAEHPADKQAELRAALESKNEGA